MSSRVVFSTPWFAVEKVSETNGELAGYYRILGDDGAVCLPLTPAGDVLMVRQFRPSLGFETLELPAGAIEDTESPVTALQREVIEETGYRCASLCLLGAGRFYPNRLIQREHMFLGIDAVPSVERVPESGVTPVLIPRNELLAMAVRGSVDHAVVFALLGLATVRLGLDLLRAPIDRIRERVLQDASQE